MRKLALGLGIVAAMLLTRAPSEAQLQAPSQQPGTTDTTFLITTLPTIVPTLPPFTTAPVPTRPPSTTAPTTAPPTTAPPPTQPAPEPQPEPEPPPTFRPVPPPTSPRVTAPPTTEPAPLPEPPPSVAAPPPGPAPSGPALPEGTGMISDKVASEPGGVVTLTGGGCTPNAPVGVKIGDRDIGTIPGEPDGKFIAIVTLPQVIPVGRYDITITCGVAHTLPIDIVVASRLDSGNSVLALALFLALAAGAVYRSARAVVRAADRPVEP